MSFELRKGPPLNQLGRGAGQHYKQIQSSFYTLFTSASIPPYCLLHGLPKLKNNNNAVAKILYVKLKQDASRVKIRVPV